MLTQHIKTKHPEPMEVVHNVPAVATSSKEPVFNDITTVGGPLLLNEIPESLDNTSLFLPQTDISQFDLGSIDNQTVLLENENLNLNMEILPETAKGLDHFNFDLNKPEPEKLICDICLKSFVKLRSLMLHMEQHTGKHVCFTCHKIFSRRENLVYHICTAIYSEKCPLCDRIFFQRKFLTHHINVVHNKRWTCVLCKKTFTDKVRLENHQCPNAPLDTSIKYHCATCQKVFFKKYSLTRHIQRHNYNKKKVRYICAVCNKILSSRGSYMKHAKLHEHVKYTCDICNKLFNRPDTLNLHKREQHSPNRQDFPCPVCDKKFKSRKLLNCHVAIHRSEKPYTCEICHAAFTQRSNFNRHSQKHKLFPERQAQNLFKDEEVKVYQCPKCHKTMKLRTSLLRHMRNFHPDDELQRKDIKPTVSKLSMRLLEEFEKKTEEMNAQQELDLKETLEDFNFSTDEVSIIDKLLNDSDNIDDLLNESGDGIVESLIKIANEDSQCSMIGEEYTGQEVFLSMPDLSEND